MKIGGEAEEGRDGGVFSTASCFAVLQVFHFGACEFLVLSRFETVCILMVPAGCKSCRITYTVCICLIIASYSLCISTRFEVWLNAVQ
jgi:hypothetical protein